MPPKTKKAPAKAAASKAAAKTAAPKEAKRGIANKRTFNIGGDIQPKRDLGRFVKWPKYVRLQRQHRVLYKRLKVPPAVHQFTHTVSKNQATELFKLLNKYRPEDKATKKIRLQEKAKAGGDGPKGEKPHFVKFGINHIAALVEKKAAQLIVVWLPALCRKMGVPYCVVKGKSRLGQVIHMKTATALALTSVKPEDMGALNKLTSAFKEDFNGRLDELRRKWGGGIMGDKTQAALARMEKIKAKEIAARV